MRVSNTKSFFDYWSSRVPVSSYTDVATLYNYCQVGDVLLWRHAGTRTIYHATIISQKESGEVRYCGHTKDKKDYAIRASQDQENDFTLLDF